MEPGRSILKNDDAKRESNTGNALYTFMSEEGITDLSMIGHGYGY